MQFSFEPQILANTEGSCFGFFLLLFCFAYFVLFVFLISPSKSGLPRT